MANLTIGIYPYFSYVPSIYVAAVFAGLVYLSLILWFVQSLWFGCRPGLVGILIFLSHLLTFSELILRATLTIEERNTKRLYRFTASLITISSQVLLASNFQCLIEMRGNMKSRIIDRVATIIVPIGLIGSGVLLGFAKNFSFNPEHLQLSFRLRQISVGIILAYIILFFVLWYFNISNVRRRYIKQQLIITSICLLTDATYVLAGSTPFFFSRLNKTEVWFYAGHLIPIFIALLTWSLLYWRKTSSQAGKINDQDENGEETLLRTSKT